ncbi:arginine--tRNA ligase [Marinomonas mediterranea]|uniref:Arginine--tRNA ligase n=1 Tax=Marinomonas mediterranea (strain ATCC 700492 / JCM 21426 / NBRC 103028 / MMB-1) TaxID=717774 RepID=F2JWT5_MARM1|nr:arginine--tRNA ligase [Marinomonas mediterranea]ADZ92952.1 Arginyl-tRNA synthetase [Marinomonas mediterranea MMB-1]WCN14929.1 arginine--tRNA ligase [Marinomonas mediterranea]WCN18973.1 arginine--tRNA ligase [Marinomonas mediterranea MMB-1]
MNIQTLLNQRIQAAMIAAGAPEESPALVRQSAKVQFGDYQANGIMGVAKKLKTNPRAFAEQVLEKLDLTDLADKVEIAGPGFINVFLKNAWLAQEQKSLRKSERLDVVTVSEPQTVVVDYSAPNLAKEMHVGHLRSTVIGDAVVRTLEFLGHKVVRQNHVGDWGTQFGMLLAYMERLRAESSEISMALSDLETFYREAKKCFDDDEAFSVRARELVVKLQSGDEECKALWQDFINISLEHCEETYQMLGVSLERKNVMPESAYNDDLQNVINDLDAKGLIKEDQGAKCVFLEEFANKDGEITPIIVQKTGGGFLYSTTDLAAVRYRQNVLKADRALYFVDARQSLHFEQIFTLSRKAGFADDSISLEHMPFGTVMGSDGKPFKTRSGGVAKLSALLEEAQERAYKLVASKNPDMAEDELRNIGRVVGVASVKYADLSKNRTSDYVFNWDTMLSFEGNTAPYLQYAYSRVASIVRNADIDAAALQGDISVIEDQERALAVKLVQFEEAIQQVGNDGMPHFLCAYLYELAGTFMSFYEACPILKADEEVKNSRLQLALNTASTLKLGLSLLGIETLERM